MNEPDKTAEFFSKIKILLEKTGAFIKLKMPVVKAFLGEVAAWLKLKMPVVKAGAIKAVELVKQGSVFLHERFFKGKKDQ